MARAFILSSLFLLNSVAAAQDVDPSDPTGGRGPAATSPDEMFQPMVSEEQQRSLQRGAPQPRRYLDNVTVVISERGEVHAEWREEDTCMASTCRRSWRRMETGQRSHLDGELQPGFMRTGRGEELIFVAPPTHRFDRRTNQVITVVSDPEEG